MSVEPLVDPTAMVVRSELGRYTAVAARTILFDSCMGDYSYAMDDCNIASSQIGKFVNIASHVRLNPSNHPMWRASQHHFSYRSVSYGLSDSDDEAFFQWRRDHPVTVGHDVWIGHAATVMPGVSIGIGAVVGSGAVVTKDVPDYGIVVGVPAKLLRYRFEADIQSGLIGLAWWDWSHEQLADALMDFRGLSVEKFIEKYSAC